MRFILFNIIFVLFYYGLEDLEILFNSSLENNISIKIMIINTVIASFITYILLDQLKKYGFLE